MNPAELVFETATEARQLLCASVVEVCGDLVSCAGDRGTVVLCEVLQTSEGPGLQLAPRDTVLVLLTEPEMECGVILGRLGPRRPAEKQPQVADELVLEARSQLTLKCGAGSITLRGDGKVLIKGKDLVSHAQRVNRVKGGAVAIN